MIQILTRKMLIVAVCQHLYIFYELLVLLSTYYSDANEKKKNRKWVFLATSSQVTLVNTIKSDFLQSFKLILTHNLVRTAYAIRTIMRAPLGPHFLFLYQNLKGI